MQATCAKFQKLPLKEVVCKQLSDLSWPEILDSRNPQSVEVILMDARGGRCSIRHRQHTDTRLRDVTSSDTMVRASQGSENVNSGVADLLIGWDAAEQKKLTQPDRTGWHPA
jgi:hypothetical protein